MKEKRKAGSLPTAARVARDVEIRDPVERTSADSFPASDPPSWIGSHASVIDERAAPAPEEARASKKSDEKKRRADAPA
ncbi:MAG: hypothetical protein AB7F08_04120 [Dongiaceae bacterium]